MPNMRCPGLPADWINAWLAAVGATVLDPRLRLHWTDDRTPVAVLSAIDSDPVDVLTEAWPTAECLTEMPLYETWEGHTPMRRKVPVDSFVERVRVARRHPAAWTVSSTMTDLVVDKVGEVAHARFDPPVPKGLWLHQRFQKAHELVTSPIEHIAKSLQGASEREQFNGLGFDLSRLGSQADHTDPYADPAIEVLAFFGLAILPVRGRGWDERLSRRGRTPAVQRGWREFSKLGRGRRFAWPAWSMPLGHPGIDALLDIWRPERKSDWARVGVHAAWHTVGYTARSTSDPTRGFGSVRM